MGVAMTLFLFITSRGKRVAGVSKTLSKKEKSLTSCVSCPRGQKMGKEKKSKRHQSLSQQILDVDKPRTRSRILGKKEPEDVGNQEYVEGRISAKILQQARLQQEELEEEFGIGAGPKMTRGVKGRLGGGAERGKAVLEEKKHSIGESESEDEESELRIQPKPTSEPSNNL